MKDKEFCLSEERKKIVQFAELDDDRWKELMSEIEQQDKEFIKIVSDKIEERELGVWFYNWFKRKAGEKLV